MDRLHAPCRRRRSTLVPILLGIAVLTTLSSAQEESDSAEFETWTDIATIYQFNDRLRYDGDYGIRSWLTTRGFRQIYFRPSVRYRAKPWLLLHGCPMRFYALDTALSL